MALSMVTPTPLNLGNGAVHGGPHPNLGNGVAYDRGIPNLGNGGVHGTPCLKLGNGAVYGRGTPNLRNGAVHGGPPT